MKMTDRIGQQFNHLVILECISQRGDRIKKVIAKCDCGIVREYIFSNIYTGKTTSCGCQNRQRSSERFKLYNSKRTSLFTPFLSESHNLSKHPLYKVWIGMMKRCYDSTDISYCRYGARGVMVCNEWKKDFMEFYNWAIVSGWEAGLQLDKDYKGNGKLYSPDTCCFVSKKMNCRNRTTTKYITFEGRTRPLCEWCEITGLTHTGILNRLKRGWSVEKTLTTKKTR